MKRFNYVLLLGAILAAVPAFANPYFDPASVPKDSEYATPSSQRFLKRPLNAIVLRTAAPEALRILVDWDSATDRYSLGQAVRERSGTPALEARSKQVDPLGSFQGILKDPKTGKAFAWDSIGTGHLYRKLARGLSFRFPVPASEFVFEMTAEHPVSGVQQKVFEIQLDPSKIEAAVVAMQPEVTLLQAATSQPSLQVAIYAEGYTSERKAQFLAAAERTVAALRDNRFPGFSSMEFKAVFAPSRTALGKARDLGLPVVERDSFLGLYFPYWEKFGRWYHVLYPTSEKRFRESLGLVPYDYPIVIVDSSEYWGVGNFMTHTAIPSQASAFTYLLMHEFGHFFGLNEEYEGGGRTELEFAPQIEEPWSQNLTFLGLKTAASAQPLKWSKFVDPATRIPTPRGDWIETPPKYGAYPGGYADSDTRRAHKPGRSCTMENRPQFCEICLEGIREVIRRDLGI